MRIREPIRVAVIFGPGSSIRPVWFDWRNRKHTIRETTYTWESRKGAARLLHFTVQEEGELYELIYETDQQSWILERLEPAL